MLNTTPPLHGKRKYVYILLPLLFILIVFVLSSFQAEKLKPTNDFSWLQTYKSIYLTFDQDQWEKLPDRSFDSLGVHLTKKMYHPVNACHYALFCYDEYLATKNERFKKAFLAQVSYLLDSTKYNKVCDDMIGYPYNFTFHDLKSPWYSALAQSEAISTLIRYYVMTRDKKALDIIVKLNNFMICPVEDGGLRSKTPEGDVWLEEYPNSKQEKQVLNGFFLSIVALYEYTHLFPNDEDMQKLYQSCIQSVKNNILQYDTGTWLRYNRGDKRLVANGYMKWQVNEMKHLYSLTNDPFFHTLFVLWTTYAYNKEYVSPGCKVAYYNWAVPMEKINNEFMVKSSGTDFYPINISGVTKAYPSFKTGVATLFDNNPNTFVAFTMNDTLNSKPFLQLTTDKLIESQMIQIRTLNDTLTKGKIKFYSRTDSLDKWKEIKIQNITYKKPAVYEYEFQKMNVRFIKIEFQLESDTKVQLAELKLSQSNMNTNDPEYYFYQTDTMRFTNDKPVFNCSFTNTDEYLVFYKSASTKEKIKTEQWVVKNTTASLPLSIPDTNRIYQFLIVLKRKNNSTGIKEIAMNRGQ